jgi:dTDP-D-glucose 4,6-dehydratase
MLPTALAMTSRYALNSGKLIQATGWQPLMNFEEGLAKTVDW